MRILTYTLRADGPADSVLLPILRWLLEDQLPDVEMREQFADPRYPNSSQLLESIHQSLELYPCDLLFIHRDAEKHSMSDRLKEINTAISKLTVSVQYIAVIPIRMTEAWLLIDEVAIRSAAGNPNGKTKLDMPKLRELESLPDPKTVLNNLLIEASELSGRRKKTFDVNRARLALSDWIISYEPLRSLKAFKQLELSIQQFGFNFHRNSQHYGKSNE
jgi:hypothetical protein